MRKSLFNWVAGLLSLALLWFSVVPATAETTVGSNVDSRVVLAFKANDEAIQANLPDGWGLLTLPNGPLAGSNLLVSFIDRHLALDAEGKPLAPHSDRSVALLAYGVKPGVEGARMFVLRVFEMPPVASSYDNGIAASISREFTLTGSADDTRTHQEVWRIEPETGGVLGLDLTYRSGRPGWSSSEAMPYSAVNPDFHRIYRYDQLVDLAMSAALGRELNGDIQLQSSIPEFAGVFDGDESLTGILVIPVYVREVLLP